MFSRHSKFNEAYSDYFPLVFSIVYQKTGDYHDSEEICQEIFINLFKKIEDMTNIRAWLLGTTKYYLLNYFRKKKADILFCNALKCCYY